MIGLTAEVALEGATLAFDSLYTYAVPPELHKAIAAGVRVTVPFGKGNLKKQGMVFSVNEAELKGLKSVTSVIDEAPVLTEEMLLLCKYMQESYFCTYYDAVHAALPTGLNYKLISYYSADSDFFVTPLSEKEGKVFAFLNEKGEKDENYLLKAFDITADELDDMVKKGALIKSSNPKRRMNDSTEKWVRLSAETDDLAQLKLTKRQNEVVNLVNESGSISTKEIRYYTGVSPSVIEGLISKGVLVSFENKVFKAAFDIPENPEPREIDLTPEQQKAFNGLSAEYDKNEGNISLLYGITGSGKTQVFLKLVDKVAASGRGVIVMVPEIALTPQMLRIFTERYGDKVAVFHSAMSVGKRMGEWQRIKNGKALIALGTRSAIFAPFKDLGLIIMDEEQEHTYKSEQSPRFHARSLASFRTKYYKGLLCLASATPSVESYTAAKTGKYSLFTLTQRYAGALLPTVQTVDMRKEILNGNSSAISIQLYEAIKETLEQKKQAILLLNRRGHNTYISCPECGYVLSCPNCSISLTYHSANNRFMCHYCGHSVENTAKCPECGSEHMKFMGTGTQKVEDELKALFKDAKILRLDADSTLARGSYAEYLNDFANGEYDILLGTQMVAKGLDFPNVTLVGVLGADSAAFSEDFRSFERTFSLLTQVVGRAGRGENAGTAIVQTTNPESNIISLAARQDYDSFYNEEILTRKLMTYPPYCDICVVSARAALRQDAEKAINDIFSAIKEKISDEYSDIKLIILGPAPAAIPVVNNKYRYRMIIKCRNSKKFRKMLKESVRIKAVRDTAITVNINPETII